MVMIKPWLDGGVHRIARVAKQWDEKLFVKEAGITLHELHRFEKGKRVSPECLNRIMIAWGDGHE